MPWDLTGNSGTDPNTNFLGTTDNQRVVIRTNNEPQVMVCSSDNSPDSFRPGLWLGRGVAVGASRDSAISFATSVNDGTGEFIQSDRTAPGTIDGAPNPIGLDFYTGYVARLRIHNDGTVEVAGGPLDVNGDLNITGTANARVKAFRIAHPLDPEHRVLVHACLEGPENAIYYRGQGRLEDGRACIELPEYFEVLARLDGRTVAVTPCCEEEEPISVLAASAVVNGRFQVRAADDRNPRQSFYWEVKAVRADVEPLDAERPKGEGKLTGGALEGRVPPDGTSSLWNGRNTSPGSRRSS